MPQALQLRILVTPNAKQPGIVQKYGHTWRVRVSAKPVDGAANTAVIKLIAKELGVAKSQVSIIRGQHSRHKVVNVYANGIPG